MEAGGGRRTRTRASTATHPSGPARIGLRSSSATSGSVVAEAREPVEEVDERRGVGGGLPRNPAHEPPGLAAGDELLGVDVGERSDPEARPRRSAPRGRRPGRTRRAARRPGPGRLPRAARRRPGPSPARRTGPPMRVAASAHGGLVREVERHAAGLRLVGTGLGGLHRDREAESRRGGGAPRGRSRRARSGTGIP